MKKSIFILLFLFGLFAQLKSDESEEYEYDYGENEDMPATDELEFSLGKYWF